MKPTRIPRQSRKPAAHVQLRRRGNACLIVAGVLAGFLAAHTLGAGALWTSWHTRLVAAVGAAAATALACYVAATLRTPRPPAPPAADSPVTHPEVTHPPTLASLTPIEQAK